ncbi:MAG: alanine--tRNA ligase-related protein [Candidatus Aminicenantes bacterium]|jgi:alanyl-tRNA synthetase
MAEETKRLYFDDPYRAEFEAKVVERIIYKQKPALILDQTCFYPESGGQPSDRGTLNSVKVLDVQEDNGKILHVVEEDITADEVKGRIDWERRFDHMQQHAGQHVLSQSLHELLQAGTLSFHLGEESSTVEIDRRKISDEETNRVEERANALIFEDREIKNYFASEEDVKRIPLRRPPQKTGLIRVVEVADFDFSACGGTHPRRTGEIGLIKILKWERIRGHIRCEFVCGRRALLDYSLKNAILRRIAGQFTVSEKEVPSSIAKLSADYKDQKKKIKKIQEKLSRVEAQQKIRGAQGQIISDVFSGRTVDEIRFLALNIIKNGEYVVLFGVRIEDRGHLVLASSEKLGIDMRELIPVVSPLVEGRGGGSPSLVEIFAGKAENIEKALDKAYDYISTRSGGR